MVQAADEVLLVRETGEHPESDAGARHEEKDEELEPYVQHGSCWEDNIEREAGVS